jgi:hypothetical protein
MRCWVPFIIIGVCKSLQNIECKRYAKDIAKGQIVSY